MKGVVKLRIIRGEKITEAVAGLFLEANYRIGEDICQAVRAAMDKEPSPQGRDVLAQLNENYRIAREESVAICQDTGMSVVFADLGQDVHIEGDFEEAVNAGVRKAYVEGYLRKSVVNEPLYERRNTGDNTPAVVHVRLTPGDRLTLTAVAKGFGSENMSALKMLTPADGVEGVMDFVVETVEKAGPNPCPPLVVGVGIGGTFEQAALLAKQGTSLPLEHWHPDPRYAALEQDLADRINALGIGPSGTGGITTALKVHVRYAPTHIAGLPVAVNICCHAARHAVVTI